jgi:hypothetical protein
VTARAGWPTPEDWNRMTSVLVRALFPRSKDTNMYNPKGLDIACPVPSRTHREEPIMDKIRFAETLDVQDPELQLLSFVVNENFYDAVRVLKSMTPKDRAVLSFHLGQLLDMTVDVAVQAKPWEGTGA